MKKQPKFGSLFRETPAKPALLRRSDFTSFYREATLGLLGADSSIESVLNPSSPDVSCLESFRRSYWAAEMWSKFPFEVEGVDRKATAMQKFSESEVQCGQANQRLADGWSRPWPEPLRRALKRARRSICNLVGDISLDEVFALSDWGPGASTQLRRLKASKPTKWEVAAHCTPNAEPYVYAFKLNACRDLGSQTQLVNGNRITTVPKNAKTDRVIAIEPDWNMFFQKGVGNAIRRRLNKIGLLREDAWVNSQARNRDLARFGSETNTFGTIDLRGASDSVSLALCELLLPRSLLDHVIALRSCVGSLEEGSTIYEKVSSMGNGYTFELETLIFWGLSTAVDEAGSVCYGDDIIVVNREIGLRLIELLEFCGFEVNPKKTFLDGPFRESCGGHYFNGADVTPPYVRKPLDSLPSLISFGNAIYRAHQLPLPPLLSELWWEVRKQVPRRFRGPAEAGDTCLWSSFDDCTPTWVPEWQCFAGLGIAGRVKQRRSPERGSYLYALRAAVQNSQWESDHADYHVLSQWSAYPWQDGKPVV